MNALKSPFTRSPHTAEVLVADRLSQPGEEFKYLLERECDLLYGKEKIRLRQGDAVYYEATVPHAAPTVKGKSCRLMVVASRDYLFHGDLTTPES